MSFIQKIGNHFGLTTKGRFGNLSDGEREDDAVTKKQLDTLQTNISVFEENYTDRDYNAANFSAVGGAFTATNTDYYDRYKVIGKTLFWEAFISGTISSTPSEITVKLPSPYIAKGYGGAINCYIEGQGLSITIFELNKISIRLASGDNYTAAATGIYINLTLEIE